MLCGVTATLGSNPAVSAPSPGIPLESRGFVVVCSGRGICVRGFWLGILCAWVLGAEFGAIGANVVL